MYTDVICGGRETNREKPIFRGRTKDCSAKKKLLWHSFQVRKELATSEHAGK